MRIAVLTHAEAADSAVFANLAKHLLGDGAISYVDRPDVGKEADAPLALAQPVASPSPAALVFGGAPQTTGQTEQAARLAAVVPPVPSAPTAATAPTAAPAGSAAPQLDTRGLPWDGRIHASTKVFVADGSWRQKRGTPPELVAQVEAELRQVMGIPAPAPAAPPAVPAVPVVNSVFAAGAAAAGLPPPVLVPPPVEAPVSQPPAEAPAAGLPQTFGDLMLWLTPHMPHKVTPEKLNETLGAFGVPSLNALISRPDLVPAIAATIQPLLA